MVVRMSNIRTFCCWKCIFCVFNSKLFDIGWAHQCPLHQFILSTQGPIPQILAKKYGELGVIEKLSFFKSAILDFLTWFRQYYGWDSILMIRGAIKLWETLCLLSGSSMMEQPKIHQKPAAAVFLAEEAKSVVITALNSTFVWLELPLICFIWEKPVKVRRVSPGFPGGLGLLHHQQTSRYSILILNLIVYVYKEKMRFILIVE